MKKQKILFIITLIIICICTFSYACEKNICVSTNKDGFEVVLEIANFIMIIVNFIFVVYVFKTEQRKNTEGEIMQYNQYWYKKFVIDDNMSLLDSFFGDLELLIDDIIMKIKENNELGKEKTKIRTYSQEVFGKLTNMHTKCKAKYCEKIDVVMSDLSKDSRNEFLKLQDYLTGSINKVLLTTDNKELDLIETELRSKIVDFKKEFIKKLYLSGKPN